MILQTLINNIPLLTHFKEAGVKQRKLHFYIINITFSTNQQVEYKSDDVMYMMFVLTVLVFAPLRVRYADL